MQINDLFERTRRLLGDHAMDKLSGASVAVFGIGGVGSYAAEALARSGVGALTLFDADKVCISNINRQLVAVIDTVGQYKTDVMKRRINQINPACVVETHTCFYSEQNADAYDLSRFSYIIDAIDTVSSKLVLIQRAKQAGVPIISSMGAGNKLDPARFEVADIYNTSVCPLAKVMRRELRSRGVESLKVVYSREEPITPLRAAEEQENSTCRAVPGSVAFVPSVAGLILAGETIKDLIR